VRRASRRYRSRAFFHLDGRRSTTTNARPVSDLTRSLRSTRAPAHRADALPPTPIALSSHSRSGKAGYVYKLGLRNGKANVDEYSPIYTPEEFKTDGDKYEGDLKLAAAAVVGVVGTGALAILLTSAL
jgi:photosystem II protein